MKNSSIHYGTSSFSSKDWVGPFYPEGTASRDFLSYYSTQFDTVEIDATYYRIPSGSTVDGWAAKTPDSFTFAAKFPRSIVHGGEGREPNPDVILQPDATYETRDKFLGVMSRLDEKLGPLLLQFPYLPKRVYAGRKQFFEKLDKFLTDLPDDFRYAVEIRNRNWLKPDFVELCKKHNAALVLADQGWMPHGDEIAKMIEPVTTDFSYIRLLGDRKKIEDITSTWDKEVIDHEDSLMRWANLMEDLTERFRAQIYIYANNHYAGHAPATIRRLQHLIFNR
ncbi:MAG: DUF72 domain-containing protein [candidate division Zixibacteria bacterium]|nr:DUF72 domain-containing protein [candidate division Zixibacteria bacterium]